MSSFQYDGIFIGLGSNLGKPIEQIVTVLKQFEDVGISVVKASALYKTPPWGKTDQPDFINQVIQIEWKDSKAGPISLMSMLLNIEERMGRIRAEKYGARIIDLDLLAYHQQTLQLEMLSLPHPEIVNRAFVLMPWVAIAPQFWLPDSRQTVSQALERLPIIQRGQIEML